MDHGVRFSNVHFLVQRHWKQLGRSSIGTFETRAYLNLHVILRRLVEHYLCCCVFSAQRASYETDRSEVGWAYWDCDARSGHLDFWLHDFECRRAFRDDWDFVWDWE